MLFRSIELEKQRKEYTFQPNIEDLDPKSIPKTNFNNDIYNEKEYKLRYERLKYGRLQRMVRNNKNNRLGLNDELKKFVKDEKEFNYIQNNQYYETDDPFYYNTLEINNSEYQQKIRKMQPKRNITIIWAQVATGVPCLSGIKLRLT